MPQLLVYFIKVARVPQRVMWEGNFLESIQKVIDPKESKERYGKPWRFSQPRIYKEYFVGKLGFKSMGKKPSIEYDDKKMDYIERVEELNDSNVSFWVIDLKRQILAFETKQPDINYQAFRGAFNKFLIDHREAGLTLEDFVQSYKFVAWVKDEVDKVVSFTAKMRIPNPDWSKVPKFAQDALRETNADTARVEFNKDDDSDEGLNTNKTINEIVQYAEEGYSSVYARGVKGENIKIFDSRKGIPSRRVEVVKGIGDDARWDIIIDVLRKFVNEK